MFWEKPHPFVRRPSLSQVKGLTLNHVNVQHCVDTSTNAGIFSLTGSKLASLGQEKNARRVSAVISIFDESSREASENSQDDEQFRARREFLKSGLPESFKKQIAKTTATKEAYSLSCSSFQPVIHMKQPPTGNLGLADNTSTKILFTSTEWR